MSLDILLNGIVGNSDKMQDCVAEDVGSERGTAWMKRVACLMRNHGCPTERLNSNTSSDQGEWEEQHIRQGASLMLK